MTVNDLIRPIRTHFLPYMVVLGGLAAALLIRQFPAHAWMSGIMRNYLSLHIVLELCVTFVSFGIASVGLATYRNTRDLHILILSVASIVIGLFDLGHMLTFAGMPDFFGPSSADKTISFWVMSRGLGAIIYFYIALTMPKEFHSNSGLVKLFLFMLTALLAGTGYYLVLFHPDSLPVLFVQGQGLTPLKIGFEWFCVVLSVLSSVLLFRKAEGNTNVNVGWMACACALYAVSGYFFTIYHDFDDLYVFTGHGFKVLSSFILFRAVFGECVSKPYARAEALAAEASAASLAKSRFLANVSHELRTPLGIITGYSDVVLASDKLNGSLRDWVSTIGRNAKQLGFLINDLLDLTKAEQEKIELNITRFDLVDLLAEVLRAFEVQAKGKSLRLRLADDLPLNHAISTDENRLRQILMNLVSNAVKYTRQGEVVVGVQLGKEDQALISVRDSGIGISRRDATRLFEPFSQVGDPARRTFGGTGLGLAVSRNLAELMGGRLTLYRSEPGRGSEFQLLVKNISTSPLAAVAKKEVSKVQPPWFGGFRVLIAEDSLDNRELLELFLAGTGVEIIFAANGREAVDLCLARKHDLVLMDLQMPEMDGFEATAKIREAGWKGNIVALTAHALQPERDRAMQNGFDGYLIKPIAKSDLLAEMNERMRPSP